MSVTVRLNLALMSIRSYPQNLPSSYAPSNWCILYRVTNTKTGQVAYRLGKYDMTSNRWFDEFMAVIAEGYTVFEETRFKTLVQIDEEKEEIEKYAAITAR